MSLPELDNLVRARLLKAEPATQAEFDGLLRSGERRLTDSARQVLAIENRFDLPYNAAHALSLAALRWHGYRSENRYLVFQCLAHTLGLPAEQRRVLDQGPSQTQSGRIRRGSRNRHFLARGPVAGGGRGVAQGMRTRTSIELRTESGIARIALRPQVFLDLGQRAPQLAGQAQRHSGR